MSFRSPTLLPMLCGAVALALLTTGCDNDTTSLQTAAPAPQSAPSADALPAGLLLTEPPAGAIDVVKAREEAKQGDAIVLRGRVGGSVSPFVDGRASFQLVDASLKACGEGNVNDKCETPWDFCCEEPKEIAAHSASVQVVGPDGKPLRTTLSGVGGLKPLSGVTVKGTVAKAADSGTLVVNATGIHVKG